MAGARDRDVPTTPSTTTSSYDTMGQPALKAEIAYLEKIRAGSTPGSVASWRIGEELSMAKLALQPEVKKEEEKKTDTGTGGTVGGGPVISPTVTSTGNISTTVTPTTPTAAEAAALVAGATTLSAADQTRENAISIMQARFKQYGLETLAAKIRQLAIDGATESTITLQLQETPEYKARFKANADRIKKNLQVLSPSEYLTVEDTYRQVLRAYGLKQFDTDEYVSQFISNDVSPTELSNRVQIAVQRVQNADPAVSRTLRDYYGIGQADLVAYTLDPATQYQKIERQVQAAEIGTAARIQGLETGVNVAEQLAAQGVTAAEAQKGYATIADILPTAEKLSSIYGGTMDTYGQSQAEQEVFNSLASAQRARQRLSAREVAQFSGASGAGRTSLSSGSGQI
jgi:hypothetical protein